MQDIGNSTTLKESSPVEAHKNSESSFRKSSRKCASQAIAKQSTVKKNSRKNAKRTSSNDFDFGPTSSTTTDISKLEELDNTIQEDSNLLTQNTVEKVTSQQNPTLVSDSPTLEPVLFLQGKITCKDVVNSPELPPPALHCQSTKEIDQLSIIDVDDESTPLVAHSSSHVQYYFSPVKEVTPTTATVVPNADRPKVETATQFPAKSVCEDKLFTPPDNVNRAIAGEHQAEPEIDIITTVTSGSLSHLDTPEVVVCNSHMNSCSDLARLTKIASSQLKTPATVTENSSTPATVVKISSTPIAVSRKSLTPVSDTQTSSNECSIETPVTVTKQTQPNHVSATVTKVKHSANVPRKAADGSPEFLTTAKRPQESQTSNTLSGTTKKQKVTPTSCFSPAKPKVI